MHACLVIRMTLLSSSAAAERAPARGNPGSILALITRLHFYVGLFVGPFILIAALSGVLYVFSPSIESRVYDDVLTTASRGPTHDLRAQVDAALAVVGADAKPIGLRPAQGEGYTTRVMFDAPGLRGGESRAIFIDPVTLAITADTVVYGTSGSLPVRTWLDHLHRDLLIGEWGRYYSELAASWLWLATLGGLVLWACGGPRNRADVAARSPRLRVRRWHGRLGLIIAIGLVFISATGLTWSKWAGDRIGVARQQFGWVTPPLITQLPVSAASGHGANPAGHVAQPQVDEHADHGAHAGHADHGAHKPQATHTDHAGHDGHAPTASMGAAEPKTVRQTAGLFDGVLATARAAGIDASLLEIRVPRRADQAWTVREVDRAWPTQVDAVAIDACSMQVVSHARFAEFPMVAKLIRWGIDAHMGILFGLANQLILAAFGLSLAAMVVMGYIMWWRRRPAAGTHGATLTDAWRSLSWIGRSLVVILAIVLGWSLPVMGVSLAAFVLVDVARTYRRMRHDPV